MTLGQQHMNVTLTRDPSLATCTLGVLTVAGTDYHTIERPWLGNVKGVSCVPMGEYRLVKHDSEAHPHTWALVNESLHVVHWPDALHPDWRSAVLIHVANYAAELRGCIAPGMARAYIGGEWMVQQSRRAMEAIQKALPWNDEHVLTIRNLAI